MPVRDIDLGLSPRADLRVLASRGTSGIDGTTSAAIGAALAHGGPAFALIGDLAFLHDAAGLALGPDEPRPDLCLVVVNNDGGGIFSTLEQAAFPGSFERLFGTPHGAELHHLAAAFGLPYQRLEQPGDLTKALPGTGLRIVEAQTERAAGAALRARLRAVAAAAASAPVTRRGCHRRDLSRRCRPAACCRSVSPSRPAPGDHRRHRRAWYRARQSPVAARRRGHPTALRRVQHRSWEPLGESQTRGDGNCPG